jgi:hypothetical protein
VGGIDVTKVLPLLILSPGSDRTKVATQLETATPSHFPFKKLDITSLASDFRLNCEVQRKEEYGHDQRKQESTKNFFLLY